jgi:hypothetical protein
VRHGRMKRLGLLGYMPATVRVALRIQLTQELQALIEYRKKDFIAIFHINIFKKRCKFTKKNLFIQINAINFL